MRHERAEQQDDAAGGLGVQEVAQRAEHDGSLVGRRPVVVPGRHRRVLRPTGASRSTTRRSAASGSRKRSARSASASSSASGRRRSGRWRSVIVDVAVPVSRVRAHVALTTPSPSAVPWTAAVVASSAASSRAKRLRSAWESSTLSYSGSRRVGAGTSGSGRSPSGTSSSSRPALVAERPQPRAQALDDLAEAGQPRPRGHVGGRRRAERGEVAQHHLVDRRLLDERAAEPRLGRRRRDLPAPSPQAPWRHLDEGQAVAAGEGQRARILGRVPLGDQPAQLADATRPFLEHGPEGGDDRRHVDVRPAWAGTPGGGPSPRRAPVGRAGAAAARRRP